MAGFIDMDVSDDVFTCWSRTELILILVLNLWASVNVEVAREDTPDIPDLIMARYFALQTSLMTTA